MNSADSLNYESDSPEKCSSKSCPTTNCPVDTSMQGAEMQDSPRGGSINSSSSSLSPIRIDASTPQNIPVSSSQFTGTCATPIAGHQLLVDPITGQHYLVPSGAQAHAQLIYQPVYYAPTPAQPVFYPSFTSGTQGALLMSSLSGGQHGVGSLVHPSAVSQRLSLAPSIVSSKLKSADSSSPSALDSSSERFKTLNEERQYRRMRCESEVRSPPMSPSYQETPPQLYKSFKTSSMKSSVSSNREYRRPSPLLNMNMPGSEVSDQIALKEQRTPLYGAPPAWWGDEKVETGNATESFTEARSITRNRKAAGVESKTVVLGPGSEFQRGSQQQGEPSAALDQKKKPIRMDIDFSKPFDDVGKVKDEKPSVVMRAPSTSFTVSFDNEDDGSIKEKMSLQDAAKKSNSRRLLRRSAPAAARLNKASSEKKILAETADPKQYLFKKMLMGDAVSSEGFSGAPEFVTSITGPEKRDVDVISEAGTYVVDEKDRILDSMASSQCIEDSDNDSDSSESTTTATTSSATDQTPPSYAPIRIADNISAGTTENNFTEKKASISRSTVQQSKGRRETQKLYDPKFRKNLAAAEQRTSTTCNVTATVSRLCTSNTPLGRGARVLGSGVASETSTAGSIKRPDSGLPSSPRRWVTGSSNSPNDNLTKVRSGRNDCAGLKNEVNQIRRVDGGRFSMRTASNGRTPSQMLGNNQQTSRTSKPPFRSSGKGTNPQRESAEMAAWLRRKDYNPMKAAAEARKLQQLKSRSDQFTANRSISFHQGSVPMQSKAPLGSNLMRSRHNKSQDDLCEENSCGSRSVLATYSKGVTENLNRLKLAEKNAENFLEASGVQKAVEQLTSKCYRSIELIRNTHQGRLPDSVESLLDRATQPSLRAESSVADQVSRLSAAFDAIQKYLEVSSCASPSPSSTNSGRASPSQHAESGANESSVP